MKIKDLIPKTALIVTLIVAFVCVQSCTALDTQENESSEVFNPNDPKYDENNYSFNTISLWGSEAAVVDCGDSYQFQGDIILSKKDLDSLSATTHYSPLNTNPIKKGACRLDRTWPDNTVPYSLNDVPQKYQNYFYEAFRMVEHGSYIKFVIRTNESSYIHFNVKNLGSNKGSYSDYIGRKGNSVRNEIFINENDVYVPGIIAHEICHAIGMYHEMCRSDRDNYVRIDFSKCKDDLERHQYKTYTQLGEPGIDVGTFDFNSIMIYSSSVIMQRLDGSPIYGQRQYLSSMDKKTLARLQPVKDFVFDDKLAIGNPHFGTYECWIEKNMRCPEGALINFKVQHLFRPSQSKYNGYSLNDFNIYTLITFTDEYGNIVYEHKIPITSETPTWADTYLNNVNIPQGYYTVRLALYGEVKDSSDPGKLNALRQLMGVPQAYLHLEKVIIDNRDINIPNEFGNPKRNQTFIQLS